MQIAALLFFPLFLVAIYAVVTFSTASRRRGILAAGATFALLAVATSAHYGLRALHPVTGGVDDPSCTGAACSPQVVSEQ